MPNHHHTTPFRRPAAPSMRDGIQEPVVHDPADMGTEYGLELRLDRSASHATTGSHSMGASSDDSNGA